MRSRALFAATTLALATAAAQARADILPDGKRALDVAVTFNGAIDSHVVAYPTDCMGLDVALNPQLEFYQNYDVVQQGKPRSPYKFCNEKTRLWVLDMASFKKVPGERVPAFAHSEWKLEEVSRVRVPERQTFFTTNKAVHATGYAMPAAGLVDESSPLAKVEEVVTFAGLPARIQNVRLTYRYKDGATEEHTYPAGSRPQPKRREARDWMAGLVGEGKPQASDGEDAGAGGADAGQARLSMRDLVLRSPAPKLPGQDPASDPTPRRSHRLLFAIALAAALGAAFALRESGEKG